MLFPPLQCAGSVGRTSLSPSTSPLSIASPPLLTTPIQGKQPGMIGWVRLILETTMGGFAVRCVLAVVMLISECLAQQST